MTDQRPYRQCGDHPADAPVDTPHGLAGYCEHGYPRPSGEVLCGGCSQPVAIWNAHLPRDTQNGVGWECRPPTAPSDPPPFTVCENHPNHPCSCTDEDRQRARAIRDALSLSQPDANDPQTAGPVASTEPSIGPLSDPAGPAQNDPQVHP